MHYVNAFFKFLHWVCMSSTPLVINSNEQDNHFYNCVLALCNQNPDIDTDKTWRRIMNVGAGICSVLPQIPWITISLKLGPVIGPIVSGSNATAFAIQNAFFDSAAIALLQENQGI